MEAHHKSLFTKYLASCLRESYQNFSRHVLFTEVPVDISIIRMDLNLKNIFLYNYGILSGRLYLDYRSC